MTGRLRCSGLRRRDVLRAGGLGFFGLTWPKLLQAQSSPSAGEPRRDGRAKACIFIYLDGGMSHIDTFDMKPEAPPEFRGEFEPIETSVPGTTVCEHLPLIAQKAHMFAQVRSLGRRGRGILGDDHHTGAYYVLTGHEPDRSFGTLRLNRTPLGDDWPFIGSTVAYKLGERGQMPALVSLPDHARSGAYIRAGQFAGRLGVRYNPLYVQSTRDTPNDFAVPALELPAEVSLTRLAARHDLMRQIDGLARASDNSPALADYDVHTQKAFSLLQSAGRSGAFDLDDEDPRLRDRYGRNVNGQSILLARRLVEHGVPFVSVMWQAQRIEGKKRCPGWDTHYDNFHCLKNYLLPELDPSYSTLLDDLDDRGLLDETLVVLFSEMGRTPKIGDPRRGGENGRDHWVHCQTVMLAGAGVKGGYVFGRSDNRAAYPVSQPVGPEDLAATVYDALGIDDLSASTIDGREFQLLEDGRPIRELFG